MVEATIEAAVTVAADEATAAADEAEAAIFAVDVVAVVRPFQE